MKIMLFGGTTEGRVLAEKLCMSGHDVTVSVATALGAEELAGVPCRILSGCMDKEEMVRNLRGQDLVIDATHPYAREVSRNLRDACRETGVSLKRILRGASQTKECVTVADHAQAAAYLAQREGNVLLTVGSKEIGAYAGLEKERLFARVLPVHAAIDACEAAGIPHSSILALQGPFTQEMNAAMIRQYRIRYLVTKDSGEAGGFDEKREAARETGAQMIVIARPEEDGITMRELLEELEEET